MPQSAGQAAGSTQWHVLPARRDSVKHVLCLAKTGPKNHPSVDPLFKVHWLQALLEPGRLDVVLKRCALHFLSSEALRRAMPVTDAKKLTAELAWRIRSLGGPLSQEA